MSMNIAHDAILFVSPPIERDGGKKQKSVKNSPQPIPPPPPTLRPIHLRLLGFLSTKGDKIPPFILVPPLSLLCLNHEERENFISVKKTLGFTSMNIVFSVTPSWSRDGLGRKMLYKRDRRDPLH
mmetsp:Transcript_23603/g.32201  ORF Transcript_23603/g.32201 Transcript_23603/m.32201 type:complete len:125 (-) Transcript_23603:1122-1496(-)